MPEATYADGGTIHIYLDPGRSAIDADSGRQLTVGELITHALAHHTRSATASTNGKLREHVAIDYQNKIFAGFGIPPTKVDGQIFKDGLKTPHYLHDLDNCFLAGTQILMADNTEKPIEEIRPGDEVMAFDPRAEGGRGALVPKKVTRTFQNTADIVIDLHGLRCTPGHVFLTGEGGFAPIASILKADGTIVDRHGTILRARTGMKAGGPEDRMVQVVYMDPATRRPRHVLVRAGIPAARRQSDGALCTLAYVLNHHRAEILDDGLIEGRDGLVAPCDWAPGSTPFDDPLQRNFIVQDGGAPYTPEWIASLSEEEDEAESFERAMLPQ